MFSTVLLPGNLKFHPDLKVSAIQQHLQRYEDRGKIKEEKIQKYGKRQSGPGLKGGLQKFVSKQENKSG